MKILVINGDCLTTNSSANLCHLSYISGMIDAGYNVDLISANEKEKKIDNSMRIPNGVTSYTYNGVSLYERLSHKMNNGINSPHNSIVNQTERRKKSLVGRIKQNIKAMVRSCYGVYGIYKPFIRNALKFKSLELYDYVISIASPASSHYITYKLIKNGNVKTKKWIQIWEDPWYGDIYGFYNTSRYYKEERKLLSYADLICYVSPLTLENQRKLFPESSQKMYWQPLPSYYKNEEKCVVNDVVKFGYFGDYNPTGRDLKPFYNAAVQSDIEVNICGTPHTLFDATSKIHIYPRLPLEKLKPLEDMTDVLVFLCNRTGGQIPGKIYQYSATNKIILFILDGTSEEKGILANYFSQFKRYVFCENTVEDISRAISLIKSKDFDEVYNVSLDCFKAKTIVQNILNGQNG